MVSEGVEGRNFRRTAFELSRRLPPADVLPLLREIAKSGDVAPDAVGRVLFPLAVALAGLGAVGAITLAAIGTFYFALFALATIARGPNISRGTIPTRLNKPRE